MSSCQAFTCNNSSANLSFCHYVKENTPQIKRSEMLPIPMPQVSGGLQGFPSKFSSSKKKKKKKQTQVCLTSAPVPPRTRAITSGLRNSESTLSIIPEAHSCLARARTGSGTSAHWHPTSCRTPRPHCLGHTCHSKAHPWLLRGPGPPQALLDSSWEQR